MVGFAGAVDKTVTKTGIPPLQKADVIVASGVIGGVANAAISITKKMII